MADLSYQDKRYLERMFEMEGGYVLDFSNRTFHTFFYDSIKFIGIGALIALVSYCFHWN
jgi:hypothetical protein